MVRCSLCALLALGRLVIEALLQGKQFPRVEFGADGPAALPAASTLGLRVLTFMLLAGAKIYFGRRRTAEL